MGESYINICVLTDLSLVIFSTNMRDMKCTHWWYKHRQRQCGLPNIFLSHITGAHNIYSFYRVISHVGLVFIAPSIYCGL